MPTRFPTTAGNCISNSNPSTFDSSKPHTDAPPLVHSTVTCRDTPWLCNVSQYHISPDARLHAFNASMDTLRLTLRVHDPLNTVFILPDGRPIYHTATSSGLFSLSGDITTIKRVDGTDPTSIATIDWHRVSPSTIKFDGSTSILSDFLVPSSGLFSHSKSFQGSNGQIYKWKTDPVMLFNAQKRPAAIWDPGSTSIFSKTRLATLDVIGDAQQTLDRVVVSLVIMYFEIIRHRRRRHNHGPGAGFGGGGGMNVGAGNF